MPLDIQLETVISVFLVCLGLVAGAEKLKPIAWSVWAGNIEKQGGHGNPFRGLEERQGFLDIRVRRMETLLKDEADFGIGEACRIRELGAR